MAILRVIPYHFSFFQQNKNKIYRIILFVKKIVFFRIRIADILLDARRRMKYVNIPTIFNMLLLLNITVTLSHVILGAEFEVVNREELSVVFGKYVKENESGYSCGLKKRFFFSLSLSFSRPDNE